MVRHFLLKGSIILVSLGLFGSITGRPGLPIFTVDPVPIAQVGKNPSPIFLPIISNELPVPTPGSVLEPIPGSQDVVLNAVGDIAACSPQYTIRDGYLQTAALLKAMDGPILGLGDYVYSSGTPDLYSACFDPVWGPLKSRIYPVPGNHDYMTSNAAGYFGYFGAAAGDPATGYYSFDLGAWHVIALNSNCSNAGAANGCTTGSPQELWLKADLASHSNQCILAFWHHPLFSSGKEGNSVRAHDFWMDLLAAHADLIVNGHDHSYERFAPQDANGVSDPVNGVTEIVAGTGGKDHSPLVQRQPNSLVFNDTTFGVFRLALHPHGFTFQFVPVEGGTFTDSGSGACHS